MLTELSDEQLMLAYANQNLAAFNELYGRYKTALYRFLLRQVDGQATAEEIFQEVWGKIIKAKDHYKVTASFRTYLYQIARNALIDSYRRKKIHTISDDELDPDTSARLADTNSDPSNTIDTQQRYTRIIDAIAALPTDQRDVFLLKEEAELSIKEIASVLQINEETCKSKFRYARKRLRVMLGQDNNEADDE